MEVDLRESRFGEVRDCGSRGYGPAGPEHGGVAQVVAAAVVAVDDVELHSFLGSCLSDVRHDAMSSPFGLALLA